MILSYKKYRQEAIKLFRNAKFDQAKAIFSLAYEIKNSEEILLFIELCDLAKDDKNDVLALFEAYKDPLNKNQEENLKAICEIIYDSSKEFGYAIQSENGIVYSDFIKIVEENKDFKNTFQSILCSTKLIISNKSDLLDFLKRLSKHGYGDLSMSFLENCISLFRADEEFENIIKKLK